MLNLLKMLNKHKSGVRKIIYGVSLNSSVMIIKPQQNIWTQTIRTMFQRIYSNVCLNILHMARTCFLKMIHDARLGTIWNCNKLSDTCPRENKDILVIHNTAILACDSIVSHRWKVTFSNVLVIRANPVTIAWIKFLANWSKISIQTESTPPA